VRKHCLALPQTSERLSHGAPTFFIRERRSFVMFHDDHHGVGRGNFRVRGDTLEDAYLTIAPERLIREARLAVDDGER